MQLQEFIVLFNPLARRAFVFRPLENRLREAKLGLPARGYAELREPLADLCWQVLPKGSTEAWVLIQTSPGDGDGDGDSGGRAIVGGGVQAIALDLLDGTAGEPQALPADLHLPLFPDPAGQLRPLEEALAAYRQVHVP